MASKKTVTASNGVSFKRNSQGRMAAQRGRNGLYPSDKRIAAAYKELRSNGAFGG